MHYVQDKVFVGLEQIEAAFNIKEKVEGPGGSYLQHIQAETGAKVFLRGKGSGCLEPASGREAFEPMYIYISHPKSEGLSAARKLCESLLQTVYSEHSRFVSQMNSSVMPPQGYQQLSGGTSQQHYYAGQGYQARYAVGSVPVPSSPSSYPRQCGPDSAPFCVSGATQPLGPGQSSGSVGYAPSLAANAPGYEGMLAGPRSSAHLPAPPAHKRRFTEESEEESALLGYQHGPIHMTNLGTGSCQTGRSGTGAIFADPCGRVKERDRHLMPPPHRLRNEGLLQPGEPGGMFGPPESLDRLREQPSMKMRRVGDHDARLVSYGGDSSDEEEEYCRRRQSMAHGWSAECRYALPPQRAQQQMPFWMAP
ncbi:KH homology domain-containing protein 4-like [Scyliorhinus canicula]|uniref:KH homology domain-containing protein 4-like n=1 Tax=Scyliorhinus canicula TaxID=7830 RepID=UPI0018F58E6E|nr:KH homology domain-containing protein 4-like [Scyliorhinus canicula]